MIDIIPDIHGQAGKLQAILAKLGWRESAFGNWSHPDPQRRVFFLGDFIDRGPENARVLQIVRSLIDGGRALAVMGNHEFNAIQFHTRSDGTGRLLRERSAKNVAQHAAFLREFPLDAPETACSRG